MQLDKGAKPMLFAEEYSNRWLDSHKIICLSPPSCQVPCSQAFAKIESAIFVTGGELEVLCHGVSLRHTLLSRTILPFLSLCSLNMQKLLL